uniref:Fe2OG dioxygenase domain-containing protein n=1 Tax=Leersia perrieri TaxID=77586 RepID=A0A0D9WMH5_9ORYZ
MCVELAGMGSKIVPRQYVVQREDHPTVAATASIPIVDLGRLSQLDGNADEVVKLRQGMESWGLFMVTNHGIEDALMDEMMDVSREFFHQPLEEKQKYTNVPFQKKYTNLNDGKHFPLEGYGNDQVISESQILDWSDRLHLKVDPADERNLSIWPKHPESFRDVLDEFIIKCDGVKNSLLFEIAKLLKLEEDYFARQFADRPTTIARFNYYPQCPRPDLVYGIKPHSDATNLTILMIDNDVGGLQVLKDGVWYDVPTIPHTLVINLGDHTEIMSNGIFKSSVHRVMTNSEKERISVAMFYFMNLEKEIEPAAELVDEEHPARYRKVKIMDYFAGLFEHFLLGTRVIDTIQLLPSLSRPDLVFGVRPHSDGALLTILLVDKDVGNLQIQRDGKWYNVPASPHTLLVNLGDTMEIICNGIFRSPVHRVVTNAEKERISLAMFFGVNGEKEIEPAAGLLDENRQARYRNLKTSRSSSQQSSSFIRLTTMAESHQWKIVKIPPTVQELAAGVHEPPSQYIVHEQDRPAVTCSDLPSPIPVIDLSRLSVSDSDDEDNAGELAKLRSALDDWGLFLAVGHGMESGLLGELMKVMRGFFELPLEEKQKYSNLVNGKEFRIEGYGNDMVVDVLREYTVKCREITILVLTKLAKLLGLQDGYFVDMFDENAMTYARFNFYPRCPRPEHVLGLKPHSDASVITIASIDDSISGLQVLRQGIWYDVPIVPNALLINVGDGIEIMSNGFFKSPVHRVVTNAESERVSLAMFYTLDPEKELEPLPELVDEEKRPRQYAKMKTKDYITRLFETFARGTRVIDTQSILSTLCQMATQAQSWMLPTIVQELAASGVQEPPSRYVRRILPTAAAAADLPELIPVIDLSKLSTVDEAAKLQTALQTWGLFTVTGHGIEDSLMDDVMNASREFFHQPLEEKLNCSNMKDGKSFQVEGYGSDQVKIKDQTMDWSDRLNLKLEPENERNFANWPAHPESFRGVLLEYSLRIKIIKNNILRAMARILKLHEDYFLNQFGDKAPITVRINHYVPCPRPNLVLGFKPHSDDGVLATLLVDNDLVALQVLRDGIWYNVPTSPRTILINIGDFMEIMSNGMFKSPVHRVVANGVKERTSLAMFYGLDPEKDIEPASGLLHVNQAARYHKVKTKDYMAGFYEHFARGTRVIESTKITI